MTEPDPDAPIGCPDGDHEWKIQDASFDHEYGCEQVFFWRCEICGVEKPAEAQDLSQPDDVI